MTKPSRQRWRTETNDCLGTSVYETMQEIGYFLAGELDYIFMIRVIVSLKGCTICTIHYCQQPFCINKENSSYGHHF